MTFSLFPRTVYKTKSKISGEIVVKELLGQYTLSVQGMIQSGGITKDVWEKALNKIRNSKFEIRNSLILGLGGGTVVQLIKLHYPEAKIIGVEIDPEIVKIGKKYFGLNKVKNLKIITADAIDWIKRYHVLKHGNKKFDLIIVDLYLGDKFPPKAVSDEFLKGIKKLLAKKGMLIFNQLKNKRINKLERKLRKAFSRIEILETPTNLFFLVSKSK